MITYIKSKQKTDRGAIILRRRFCVAVGMVLMTVSGFLAFGQQTLISGFDPNTGTITDEQLAHGVPLGGIGDGKIELMTDGSFGNFTINDNWDHPYGWCKSAFAAIRTQIGNGAPVVRMLRLTGGNEFHGVTNVTDTKMQGWFPQGTVQYIDAALPVQVTLNAFSPLIPHDIKDSSLPVACLTYTVTNTSSQTVNATFLLSWPNLLGIGGTGANDNNTTWNSLVGDTQTPFSTNGVIGLRFNTTQNYPGQQRQNVVGEYFVGVRTNANMTVTLCTNWDASAGTPTFWPSFVAYGTVPAVSSPIQPAGAVAAQVALSPGQSQDFRFYVVWYMPHLITQMQNVGALAPASPSPTNAVDRWTTSTPQQPGDNIIIDLGQPWTPTQLMIDQGTYLNDYPRGLQVETSTNQLNWTTVATMTTNQIVASLNNYSGTNFTVSLQLSQGRYLRLTDLGSNPTYWWSIHALRVSVQEQGIALAFVPVSGPGPVIDKSRYYCNWFQDAPGIAAYVDLHADSLLQQTAAWQTPIKNSNLPFWLQLNLINCAFPMVANTVLTRDGIFSVQEAPCSQAGQLGTMDQRMASHAFSVNFFPELDRAELELYADEQQANGSIPHCDGNVYDGIGTPKVPYGLAGWPDLCCSWEMQCVKMFRWTGDTSFLQRMQPHIVNAMNYLAQDHQGNDPIPEGGSTYDYVALPDNGAGAFSYTASCYLGALEAATATATFLGDSADANAWSVQRTNVQSAIMSELWNGTYLRKFNSVVYGNGIENSYVAALAGDWLARQMGLPRTMNTNLLQQENYQLITRHLKPFYPVPPMEVTPDGRRTIFRCFLLQDVPYLGCESIYNNFVDDGLDVLHRTYQCAWELNRNPWYEDLGYNDPEGTAEGYTSYMTSPSAWHVLNALSGVSVDIPDGILFVSPRLPSSMTELHLPLYFPRFWAQFDYVPAQSKLALTITKVFTDAPDVESTLYHASGTHGTGPTNPVVITSIAADGDAPLISLPQPFTVQTGAMLDLSAYLSQLVPGAAQAVPAGEATPIGKTIILKSISNNQWLEVLSGNDELAADQSAPNVNPANSELFNVIDLGNGYIALQSAANGNYVSADNAGASPLVANRTAIGPWETFLLILDGNGRLALRAMVNYKYVTANNSGSTLFANQSGFPNGSTIAQIEQNEVNSGEIFQWNDAATPSGLIATSGNAQVALSWTPAMNATSYNVKRSITSDGPYVTIASTSLTHYTDTNVGSGVIYYYTVSAVSNGTESENSSEANAMPEVVVYAVNCGGSAVGQFTADAYYSTGGSTFSTSAAIDTGGAVNPAPQTAYQTERYRTVTYTFPNLTPNASYKVRLHFSENYATANGQRVFNVFINGTQVMTNFDIFLTTTSQYRAIIEEFNVHADGNGRIAILFSNSSAGDAKINAIEIDAVPPPPPATPSATAGNSQVTLTWTPSHDSTNYAVFRGLASGGPHALLGYASGTKFLDLNVVNGVTYYYRLRAEGAGGASAASVEVYATPLAPWRLLDPAWLGKNGLEFAFAGPSNVVFSVWASTNLLNWIWLGSSEEIFPGQYRFTDVAATNYPMRFYRVSGP